MTICRSLPAEVLQWIGDRLGGILSATDVSWQRDNSRVWQVASDSGDAYVKISPDPLDYSREVYAYEHAVPSLGLHEAPRLLDADPGLLTIMTSPLPGLVVRGLSLEPGVERRVHELAGRLLGVWHAHPAPAPDQVRFDAKTSLTSQAAEAAGCMERIAKHLTMAECALVQRVADELGDLADDLPIVFCHGDFSPRNWLWDAERATCGLIDFEQSEPSIAVNDLIWLCGGVWPERKDLEEAFLNGYGRELIEAEKRALPLLAARLAASYLSTGLDNDEVVLVKRGRKALADLVSVHG